MILGPIYAVGVLIGLVVSFAYFVNDWINEVPPRKAFGNLLLNLLCTVTWPMAIVTWLILVLYKDDWKILR